MSSHARKKREFWTPEYWRGYCESDDPYRQYKLKRDKSLAVELLGPSDGELILEVGCGYGRISQALLGSAKIQLVGLDQSASMLRTCQQSLSGGFKACRGDAGKLPFADGRFDAVLCSGVLMHLQDQPRALKELCRVLRPGGRLVVSGNNIFSPVALPVMIWMLLKAKVRQTYKRPSFYVSQLAKFGVEVHRMVGDTIVAMGLKVPGLGIPMLPVSLLPALTKLDRWLDRSPLNHLAYEMWFLGVKAR